MLSSENAFPADALYDNDFAPNDVPVDQDRHKETTTASQVLSDTQRIGLTSQRGSFDFLSMSFFSSDAACIPLLKAQHDELLRNITSMLSVLSDHTRPERDTSLEVSNLLTEFSCHFNLHISVREARLVKRLAKDPRSRGLVNQLERESLAIRSTVSTLLRDYLSPSSILFDLRGFSGALSTLLRQLTTVFKDEERELFPAYEKLLRL